MEQRALPAAPSVLDAETPAPWEVTLRDIATRLRTASEKPSPSAGDSGAGVWAGAPEPGDALRRDLLQCANDLDGLHTILSEALGRQHRLESLVFDAQAELARAVAELIGTRAGEREALHRARHDSLTQLPNRSFFDERLDHVLSHRDALDEAPAVLFIDLDGFKCINDRHGHEAGDEVLRIVAARLSHAMRARDMVARIGGDEFACLLTNVLHRNQLEQLARKLLGSISAPVKIGAAMPSVRPSIGIAMVPADGLSGQALLKSADLAMYRAKKSRRGYAFYSEPSDTKPSGSAPACEHELGQGPE